MINTLSYSSYYFQFRDLMLQSFAENFRALTVVWFDVKCMYIFAI